MKKALFSNMIFGLSIAFLIGQFACQSGSGRIKIKVENDGFQICREVTTDKHSKESVDQPQARQAQESQSYFLKTKDSLSIQQPNLNRVSIGFGKALFEKYIK